MARPPEKVSRGRRAKMPVSDHVSIAMPARRMPARKRNRSCLKVIAPALEQRIVGISHGFGLAASDHDLEINRLQTVVLIAMDDPRRAGDAFPGAEPARDLAAVFILDKDVEMALQDKEDFFDFMGVRGIALAGRHEHDGQREIAGRDRRRIAVFSRAPGADEAVLRALEALDLRIFERSPIRLAVGKTRDIALHDRIDRYAFEFLRARVSRRSHVNLLRKSKTYQCCPAAKIYFLLTV